MKASEESNGATGQENTSNSSSSNSSNFEFHRSSKPRKLAVPHGKPTPSKWDDAQKWIVAFTGAEEGTSKSKPRNSNAEDRRLLHSASQKGRFSCSSGDGLVEEGDTKNIDCKESSFWKVNKSTGESPIALRSVCVRDMGTEMTPVASQGPSRAATPVGAATPVPTSPVSSKTSTPERARNMNGRKDYMEYNRRGDGDFNNLDALESRAAAWDEAERAKDMARYKREEVKIQAWENREKRKAEMEMKRIEIKAERLKTRAHERLTNKMAATRRIAEEKRAAAEAKLNERAARTAERADYIRKTGQLPSSFSFRFPSLCR